MVDITLPSGKVIRGVPAGTSKQEIKRRAIAAGFATEQDFASTTSLGTSASPGPTPLERFQSVDPMLMEQAPIDPRALVGAAETIATFGTGAVAEPVAGVVGLTTSPFQGAGQGVRNIQATRQALTYQPRTQAGQRAVSEIGQGLQPAAEVISQPSQYLGERGYQYGGPVLGAIGQTAIPAAMEMIPGAIALRTVRERRMPEPSMQPAPVTPEAPIGQATPTTQAEPELTQPTREGVEQVNVGLQGIRRGRTEALASQVMPDMQIMQDAEALGISLNPAHYSTSRAYIDMENSLKSRLGTELASAEEKAIRDLGIQADRLIQDFGGYTDRDLLNAEVRSNFTTTIKDLKTKSDYLYQDVVDARIPAEVRVTPENSIAYLEQQKTKLGGNTRLFNQAEKDLLNLVKDTDSPPTYFALNRVRMNIGRAMRGEDSPYSSLGRAELAQAYSVLSNDQMNVADAFGVGNDLRDANALVEKRKNIEDSSIELLGRELRDSILPKVSQSATALTKGDTTKLSNLMTALPEELRPQAASTLIGDLFVSGGRRSADMSAGFVNVFRALDRNKTAKDMLFSYLPPEARTRFDMIGRVATGIYRAKGLENVSRSARDVIAALESGGLLERIYGVGKRVAAAEGVSTGVGMPGMGTAVTVANVIAEKATPAVEAADSLLASRQFERAVQSYAAGAANQAENALKNSPQYQQWLRSQNANIRAEVAAIGFIPWLFQTNEEGE